MFKKKKDKLLRLVTFFTRYFKSLERIDAIFFSKHLRFNSILGKRWSLQAPTRFDGDSKIIAGLHPRDNPVDVANDKMSFRECESLRAIRLVATILRDKEIVSFYNRSIYYYMYTECMYDIHDGENIRACYTTINTFPIHSRHTHIEHDTHVSLLI